MRLCFFGAYDPAYPRHTVIKKGLRFNDVEVSECWIPPKYKFWLRYPILASRYLSSYTRHNIFFVPEFCQKDVPLVKILSLFSSKKIVFDPLAGRFETKIIDWKRNPLNSWQARLNFKIDYWAFKLSDLILADTQAHKDYFCQKYGLPSKKVEVLPVGFDDDLFRPSVVAEKGNRFTVLFFGSFLPLHGVDCILEAANIISSEEPSIQFRLVGSGQTLLLAKDLASKFGLSNVLFEDWLPMNELPNRIASSDICLGIFGRTEKARRVVPHKIFQAMGMRKPVITGQTPAVEEFFSHREDIFLIQESRSDLLAQAILELKRDEDLREGIAERGYQLVSQKFSPEAIGRTLIKILEKKLSFGEDE
ncbi:MAG TPA: glycosyltransferase [Candidatus Aminicenantes bacterium]|nr:glycosyltransferase [Candidatus Aminicenantes bacterium]